jgi:hypothetical protein
MFYNTNARELTYNNGISSSTIIDNSYRESKKTNSISYITKAAITTSNVNTKISNPTSNSQIYSFGPSNDPLWLALGTGINTLSVSYDGNSWIGLGLTIFSVSGNAVAWNGSMWVAVGEGTNTVAYSYNGINWVGLGTTIFSLNGNGIIWDNNLSLWVAVGRGANTIAYSNNGIIWTSILYYARNSLTSNSNILISSATSNLTIMCIDYNDIAHKISYSLGQSWETLTTFSSAIATIASSGSMFVAFKNSNSYYSYNGSSLVLGDEW